MVKPWIVTTISPCWLLLPGYFWRYRFEEDVQKLFERLAVVLRQGGLCQMWFEAPPGSKQAYVVWCDCRKLVTSKRQVYHHQQLIFVEFHDFLYMHLHDIYIYIYIYIVNTYIYVIMHVNMNILYNICISSTADLFARQDNSNRVTWERFQEGANRVFFHNDLPGAWRYLTVTWTMLGTVSL